MKCPHCSKEINPAAMLGSIKSDRKAKAARLNGAQKKILKASLDRCESAVKRVKAIESVVARALLKPATIEPESIKDNPSEPSKCWHAGCNKIVVERMHDGVYCRLCDDHLW